LDLIKVTVNGFKRFKESSHMYVGGKLIAIVGANEAGKSSFLDALVHWSHGTEFVKSGASQELSRDLYDSPNEVSEEKEIVVCDFVLNTEDKEALKNIPEKS
jgi:predicted ATP-dependent endonuclease of OLD family